MKPAPCAEDLHTLALAAWLRCAREAMGLTQGQVADASGLSQPVLSRLETGAYPPDVEQLRALARALEADVGLVLRTSEGCAEAMLCAGHALVGSKAQPTAAYLRGRLGQEGLYALAVAAARAWHTSEAAYT